MVLMTWEGDKIKLPSTLEVLDVTDPPLSGDVLVPFAVDDLACAEVGHGAPAILHMWTHEHALVVGLRDSKLPHAHTTMEVLRQKGCHCGVRHSGGAAVPLDAGVLNVSLILPKQPGAMDFRDDFELLVQLITDTARRFGVQLEAGEVMGSYCPGDYDLGVKGRKVAGLAQRRQTRAIAIQAFIVVEGEGEARVARAQEFYRWAVASRSGSVSCGTVPSYPVVTTGTVSSLQELGLATITVKQFKEALLAQLQTEGVELVPTSRKAWLEQPKVKDTADAIRKRYESLG